MLIKLCSWYLRKRQLVEVEIGTKVKCHGFVFIIDQIDLDMNVNMSDQTIKIRGSDYFTRLLKEKNHSNGPEIPIAQGKQLNKFAEQYDTKRRWFETDKKLRRRLIKIINSTPKG